MSIVDVARLARNADIVEKAVLQFEREIVCRVRSKCSITVKILVNKILIPTQKPTPAQRRSYKHIMVPAHMAIHQP